MFAILIDKRAFSDIQNTVDYYNSNAKGLGKKFEKSLEKELLNISKNPFYQVRYKNVRCKLIKKFPYLIHYTINSKLREVYVFAVLCTHKNIKQLKKK